MEFDNRKPTRKDCMLIYNWCVKEYGRSKINGPYPRLLFRKPNYETGDVHGHYDPYDNEIYINNVLNDTLIELVETMIHEWTHYHQPMKSKYYKLSKIYSYRNNPLEIEARMVSERDKVKCYKELFS